MDEFKIRIMRDLITFYSIRREMKRDNKDTENVDEYIAKQENALVELLEKENTEAAG